MKKECGEMSPERAFSTTESQVVTLSMTPTRYVLWALLNLVAGALLLRVGGMVSQVVVTANFGIGTAMDAYFVAAAFPLLLVQLISSALEAAVVPVYSRLHIRSDRRLASMLLSTLVNCLVLGAALLTLILFVIRQPLVFFSAPGLDPGRSAQAVALTPLLYLTIPLSLVAGLLECLLNAEGQFGWPAYAGLLVPLTTALLTLVEGRNLGIIVLCVGGIVGTALQLLVVGIRVRRARLRYHWLIDVRNPDLHLILRAVWPVLLGALITQASPLVDQIFASTLSVGNISALNYALKLVSVFIGVVCVSVGRAVLPYLARQAALNDPGYSAFKSTLRLYLWGVGLCTLLLSLLLLLLGRPLVALLFQHGAFSATDTRNTAIILSGFAPGLTPIALGFLLSRAFNALGETRVPMYMALVNVGANAVFDALLAHLWQGMGIALATSTVSLGTTLLLLALLRRRIGPLQAWRVVQEIQTLTACVMSTRRERGSLCWERWPGFYANSLGQSLLYGFTMVVALAGGVAATVRDALTTLRIETGLLLLLGLVYYPFVLLLTWASLNVCIGSSLAIFNGNNLDMVLILSLLCVCASLPWREIIRRMPALIWLGLYLGWVFIGINLSPLDTRAFLVLWLTMLASVGVAALTIALVTTRQRLCGLIDCLLATASLAALYGLYGFATRQHGEVDPDTLLFRVTSLFTQATTFAFYLSSLIPLAFYRCLYIRKGFRPIYLAVVLCLPGALLLTFTRSALIGLFLGTLVMALCLPARRVRFLTFCSLLLLCASAFCLSWNGHLPLLARFFNEDMTTFNGRIYLWQALLRNFQVTRWRGNGLQSSDQLLAYLQVGAANRGVIGTAPHSLFLGTLYDHGVIGLLLLCMVFLSLGYRLLQGIWRTSGEQRMLYAAALASLVSILLQSLGSRDLWIQAAGVSFWIVVALPFACCWPKRINASVYQSRNSRLLSRSPPASRCLSLCKVDKRAEGEI